MASQPIKAGGGPAPAARPRRHMPMTGWYNPPMLVQTGIRVIISTIFGAFADRREIIAAANAIAPQPFDPSFDYSAKADAKGEFWLDYVADTGDGWDSTYAIARLVTEPALSLGQVQLPRGQILVLGGDQVYPTPTRQAYEDRLIGPFEEALSGYPAEAMPDLYALPGNHDWYDGLSAFLALFCRRRIAGAGSAGIDRPGREIAGRPTRQTRSYFALKLPRGWWLWGTDSQIQGYLDQPQVDFFQYVASSWMDKGSKVILCCGQPSWAYTDARSPQSTFTTFSYLERLPAIAESKAGEPMGHELKLVLTGDSHHYSRYSEDGSIQYITAGGGGAFLHPTHQLVDRVFTWDYAPPAQNVRKEGSYPRHFRLQNKIGGKGKAVFPDQPVSKALTRKNFAFAFRNPGMLLFYWLCYTIYFWSLEASAIIAVNQSLGEYIGSQRSFLSALAGEVLVGFATPWPTLLFVSSMAIYVYFADEPHAPRRRLAIGITHGLLQATLVTTISCAAFWLSARVGASSIILRDAIPILVGSLVAAFASASLFGCYLWFSLNRLKIHWNEAFSSLTIKDFKNFLRIKIARDGSLQVYPIGLAEVPAGRGAPAPLHPTLIEGPILVAVPPRASPPARRRRSNRPTRK